MDNALLFSDSFSISLILDTYRSDQFTIVKSTDDINKHKVSFNGKDYLIDMSLSGDAAWLTCERGQLGNKIQFFYTRSLYSIFREKKFDTFELYKFVLF